MLRHKLVLGEIAMAIAGVDLREFRQTCRIRVRIGGEETVTRLRIGPDHMNDRPVGERIFLDPGGWYDTADVELLEVLLWED